MRPGNRIFQWLRHLAYPVADEGLLALAGSHQIAPRPWRIGANDQEIGARREALMPGAGGQHDSVAFCDPEFPASETAEAHQGFARGNAQNLVGIGMIVREGIDAIAPAVAP